MKHQARILSAWLAALSLILPLGVAYGEAKSRPNILLIVADDLGYSDLGAYGGEIRTPHIDSLAKSGTLWSDFRTAPTCSPTRAMLLSGTDNHLAGLGSMGELLTPNQKGKPGYEGFLNDRVVSIAQVLKDAGYFTCMAGKWHLGDEIEHDPSRKGFRRSYTMLQGGASHFDDEWMLSANYTPVYREDGERTHVPSGFYSSEFYVDKLTEYIGSGPVDKPFFAYLSFTAVHDPLHVPDEWLGKYDGAYDDGYSALRNSRLERMKQLGLIHPDAKPFPLLPNVPAWKDLTAGQKKEQARTMEVYAALTENMDHHVGRMLTHLEIAGAGKDTLVLFFSDNGANGSPMTAYPETDQAWIDRNSDNRLKNYGRRGSRIALGPAWGQSSMVPFRLFKGFQSEGGKRAPLIIAGAGINAREKPLTAYSTVMDISATILDAAQVEHPGASYQGRKIHPLRGRSLLPVARGKSNTVWGKGTPVCSELFGFRAVRMGDHKALWLPKPFGIGDWQLYDLAKDPGELNDLSKKLPDLHQKMVTAWDRYAEEVGVVLPEGDFLGGG